jgi:hypothetical protein
MRIQLNQKAAIRSWWNKVAQFRARKAPLHDNRTQQPSEAGSSPQLPPLQVFLSGLNDAELDILRKKLEDALTQAKAQRLMDEVLRRVDLSFFDAV